MFVTYAPDEGKPQAHTFYPQKIRNAERERIEKASGIEFGAWTQAIQSGNSAARRVLLWVLLRREHPTIKLADVDFAWDELRVENSAEEMQALLDHMTAKADVSPEIREALTREIESATSDPELVGKAQLPIAV